MLVDLPADWTHPKLDWVPVEDQPKMNPERLAPGMYSAFLPLLSDLISNEYPFEPDASLSVREKLDYLREQRENDLPQSYGICDSIEQVTARWPQLHTDPRPLIVVFRQVTKADCPDFRFHKNGAYIGSKQIVGAEHLVDEPHVEQVLVFQIVELDPHAAAFMPVTAVDA